MTTAAAPSLCSRCGLNAGGSCAVNASPFRHHAAGGSVQRCASYKGTDGFQSVAEGTRRPPAPGRK